VFQLDSDPRVSISGSRDFYYVILLSQGGVQDKIRVAFLVSGIKYTTFLLYLRM
jgi:hypothetical protein